MTLTTPDELSTRGEGARQQEKAHTLWYMRVPYVFASEAWNLDRDSISRPRVAFAADQE